MNLKEKTDRTLPSSFVEHVHQFVFFLKPEATNTGEGVNVTNPEIPFLSNLSYHKDKYKIYWWQTLLLHGIPLRPRFSGVLV